MPRKNATNTSTALHRSTNSTQRGNTASWGTYIGNLVNLQQPETVVLLAYDCTKRICFPIGSGACLLDSRVQTAIRTLQEVGQSGSTGTGIQGSTTQQRKPMGAAQRKRLSLAAKQRHAERQAQGKSGRKPSAKARTLAAGETSG